MYGAIASQFCRRTALLLLLVSIIASWHTGPARAQDESKPLSQGQIEQLVAPIALHPDPLISQILMASTYPLEVVEAQRWVKANPGVTGDALQAAMQKQSWDESVKSLTAFPEVLDMMSDKLSWTQQLGDAFLAQQEQVLAAIQSLRARADAEGNLTTTKEQKVEKQSVAASSGKSETIYVIEPANPKVVYVPSYNPTIIYGAWPYPAYPPYYWYPPGYVASRAFWFATGVAVGSALWGRCDWRRGSVSININNYNSFNHTNITSTRWQHNAVHRKGVPYRNADVAHRYGKGRADARVQAREQFRGRAETGRRELAKTRPGGAHNAKKMAKPRPAHRPATKKPAVKRNAAKPKVAARKPAAKRPSTHRASRPARQPAAFKNVGHAKQARHYSARGKASRSAARARSGGHRGGGHRGGGRRR